MGKEIHSDILPYFFKSGVTLLTMYSFSIDAPDDNRFIVNSSSIKVPLSDGGIHTALSIKRTAIRSEEGTVLNELEIGLDNVDLAFKNDVIAGKYNDKECKVYLGIFEGEPYAPFPVESSAYKGKMLVYHGFMDEPKGDEHWVTFSIRPFPLLERDFPKRVYQSGCNWTFCGFGCGLDLDDYKTSTSLTVESTDGKTLTCSHGQIEDYFIPGFVKLTSGTYIGEVRPVLSNSTTQVILRIPFDDLLPNGTTLDVYKLCPKHYEACQHSDFDNFDEYGGYPWVPKEPIL